MKPTFTIQAVSFILQTAKIETTDSNKFKKGKFWTKKGLSREQDKPRKHISK